MLWALTRSESSLEHGLEKHLKAMLQLRPLLLSLTRRPSFMGMYLRALLGGGKPESSTPQAPAWTRLQRVTPHLGDLLMQRFKKLELEALEGDEQAGDTLELLPQRFVGLAGQQELEAAQAEEIRLSKLHQARRGRAPY